MAEVYPPEKPLRQGGRLRELAFLFLKLGTIGFGGPAVHIAMMEDEVVRRRGWLSHEKFLDLLVATNLIPGPNSTEMAIHVGHQRAGWKGLLVAGACFIVPAVLVTLLAAWMYKRLGTLPEAAGFLYGIKAVTLAIILQALWRLGKNALKTKGLAALGLLTVVFYALGTNELVMLAAGGLLTAAGYAVARKRQKPNSADLVPAFTLPPSSVFPVAAATGALTVVPFSFAKLFLFFLKTGSVLFGSGYVLLAFLRADLVDRWHWLTSQQLLDAVAVGQITPGPVFTTATFIGYLLGGFPGAVLATMGIFLPAFLFVAASGPLVPRLRRSPTAGAFLDGVVVSSLSLMGVVTYQLGRFALVDVPSAVLFLASTLLLFRFKINSVWLVLGGGILGPLLYTLR